jgi:hypothetical protein
MFVGGVLAALKLASNAVSHFSSFFFWFYWELYLSNKQPNKGAVENGTNPKQESPV